MIRNEVDMARKLVVQRVEGELTPEDLRNDARFWSRGVMSDCAIVFNPGSTDLSGLTLADLQPYVEMFGPKNFSGPFALVANTDEQWQAAETFVQLAVQAGFSAERTRIFDNEEDAIDWVFDSHAHGN